MRTLTIYIEPDLATEMAQFAERAKRGMATGEYQGEFLTFPTAAQFFSRLTPNRWQMVNHLLGAGVVGVRELARQLKRDTKRVHEDSKVLVKLGLLEKTETGALHCPYQCIHIDMRLMPESLPKAA